MRVIYGGSFDPVHLGHVALARYVASLTEIDEVWLMPARRNPLKKHAVEFSDAQRLAMAKAAVAEIEGVEVNDMEMHMPFPSYTINTLRKCKELFPNEDFKVLIGADNWPTFHKWRDAEKIINDFGMMIYPRRGSDLCFSTFPDNVIWLGDAPMLDVSSTQVRAMLRANKDVAPLTGKAVAQLLKSYINYSR